MSSVQRDNDSDPSEKCGRLEQLLHQALALAGEIAEDKGQQPAKSRGHLPGEYIILRKAAVSDVVGAQRRTVSHGSSRMRCLQDLDEESENNQCSSAAPSIQEPFSPRALALSLDAVVEENRSDHSSCLFDSGSTLSFASPFSETLNDKTTSLSSIDEAVEHSVTSRIASSSLATAIESPRQGQERSPPPSKTTSTQTPASSQLSVLTRSASTKSCPLPASRERIHPATDVSGLAVRQPPSPGKGREDDYAAATPDGEDRSPPSTWHVRIVPVPPTSPTAPTAPSFIKLEAVFPYRYLAENNNAAASPPAGGSSEEAYIVIGQPPQDACPGGSHSQGYDRVHQAMREKSLRDYIDEWDDYAAEMLDADDAR